MWSWIGGSDQPNATGNYNTLGQEHSLNSPGARYGSCSFKDSQGKYIYLWRFLMVNLNIIY